jgi:DNA-binding CsgD family transcriptional regulator/nucleotide-binding universal stress UspA family protein
VYPNTRKILFLTVFSTTVDPALWLAAVLARESGSTLLIVEVKQREIETEGSARSVGSSVAEQVATRALPVDIRVEVRRIAPEELVEVASADDIELIVLGAHARDRLRNLLSVTPASGARVMDAQPPGEGEKSPLGRDRPPLRELLTAREAEVLVYLAQGLTVKECARVLRLSPSTIDNHKSRMMRKLNLHRMVDLARIAVREGLLPT